MNTGGNGPTSMSEVDFLNGVSASPERARELQMNQLIDGLLKKRPNWSRRRARRWLEREEAKARGAES